MDAARHPAHFEYDLHVVASFMRERLPGFEVPASSSQAIGLRRGGALVAGVVFEGINRHNAFMHVAAEPGRRWMTRDYLRACFVYPFIVCGLRRVTGYVDESNMEARRFDEHLGFKEEARLKGAAKDGSDVILYVMWREWCRYV